jgi:CBS domain-containing protein
MKASDIMTKDVVTIRSSATVADAIQLMQERGWRSLIVDRENEQDAYGILTETDIAYKVTAAGADPHRVLVKAVMTKPCIVVNPDLSVENVAKLFANHHLLRAPVIQDRLLGIISISDLLVKGKAETWIALEEQRSQVSSQHLETLLRTFLEEDWNGVGDFKTLEALDNLCSG